ncbi:MAG: hypothetical protein ACFCUR_20900 [Rhodomicrobiaceae bacterium]
MATNGFDLEKELYPCFILLSTLKTLSAADQADAATNENNCIVHFLSEEAEKHLEAVVRKAALCREASDDQTSA